MPRAADAPDRARFFAAVHDLAPWSLAAPWDNVGTLLDPFGIDVVERVLLTIDLTEAVADEAIGWGADAIVAYHPPIFRGLQRLTPATAQGRVLLRLCAAGIPVVAPHTALDAAEGGMGDWLAEALGAADDVVPIEASSIRPTAGMGRRGVLRAPAPLPALIERARAHLRLGPLRVAAAHDDTAVLARFAVCPGAGGELLAGLRDVDLVLTGELRHHDVLALVGAGVSVLLTEHSNCERGYLPRLAARLREALPTLQTRVSERDRDPLQLR